MNVDRELAGEPSVSTFQYTYDMTGRTLRTKNIDAGDDRMLANVMGNPTISLDARGHKITAEYDALHRPTRKTVEGGEESLNNLVEATIYGEVNPSAVGLNMRGQVWKAYDPSGRTEVTQYDFKGQPLQSIKLIRSQYQTEVDWTGDEDLRETLLEMDEPFVSTTVFDALGRVVKQTNPDNSEIRPGYHPSGLLNTVNLRLDGEPEGTEFVTGITYNPRGQRETVAFGNNTQTTYVYDDTTFRLVSLMTAKSGNTTPLQDIRYVYDPVGNPVKITDDAYNRVFSTSGVVDPVQTYTYDALYRLIEATGRSHSELTGNEFAGGTGTFKQSLWSELNNLNKLYIYTRKYDYDKAGNLYWVRHIAPDTTIRFTREIDVDQTSNRAILHRDGIDNPNFDDYFDANGNQTDVSHLAGLEWNYRDNIAKVVLIDRTDGPNDVEYYVYDASGQRVRKVTERYKNSTTMAIEEKLYLGGMEIKRRRERNIATSVETDNFFERVDLHVMDDKSRIAIVNKWNIDDLGSETTTPGAEFEGRSGFVHLLKPFPGGMRQSAPHLLLSKTSVTLAHD